MQFHTAHEWYILGISAYLRGTLKVQYNCVRNRRHTISANETRRNLFSTCLCSLARKRPTSQCNRGCAKGDSAEQRVETKRTDYYYKLGHTHRHTDIRTQLHTHEHLAAFSNLQFFSANISLPSILHSLYQLSCAMSSSMYVCVCLCSGSVLRVDLLLAIKRLKMGGSEKSLCFLLSLAQVTLLCMQIFSPLHPGLHTRLWPECFMHSP